MLTKYDLKMPHAVFSGDDALGKIRDIFAENNVKRLAVFTDKGIEGAGLVDLFTDDDCSDYAWEYLEDDFARGDYGDALLKAGKVTREEYEAKQAEAKRLLEG